MPAYQPGVPVIGYLPLPRRADYATAVRAHRINLSHARLGLAALIAMAADHLVIVNIAVPSDFQKH